MQWYWNSLAITAKPVQKQTKFETFFFAFAAANEKNIRNKYTFFCVWWDWDRIVMRTDEQHNYFKVYVFLLFKLYSSIRFVWIKHIILEILFYRIKFCFVKELFNLQCVLQRFREKKNAWFNKLLFLFLEIPFIEIK